MSESSEMAKLGLQRFTVTVSVFDTKGEGDTETVTRFMPKIMSAQDLAAEVVSAMDHLVTETVGAYPETPKLIKRVK